jgi:hypothetical protein
VEGVYGNYKSLLGGPGNLYWCLIAFFPAGVFAFRCPLF